MSVLGPIHEDVPFDWSSAAALHQLLRTAATLLHEQVHQRHQIAKEARQEWRGVFADEFTERMRLCLRDGGRLHRAMAKGAGVREDVITVARAEQNRREHARAWEHRPEVVRRMIDPWLEPWFILGAPDEPKPHLKSRMPANREGAAHGAARNVQISSARPSDLLAFTRDSRMADDMLRRVKTALGDAYGDFRRNTRWGRPDATELLTAFAGYVDLNEADA